MQMFLALAVLVGAFALGLGLLVLDRIDARATPARGGRGERRGAGDRHAPRERAGDAASRSLDEVAELVTTASERASPAPPELHLISTIRGPRAASEGPKGAERPGENTCS
jgi:hypothetical protein